MKCKYALTTGLIKQNTAAAAAKLLQSCPTLCDPIDGSPPGSSVPGILQARTLELVAISFSNAWKWKVKVKLLSHVWLFTTQGLQPTRLLCPWGSVVILNHLKKKILEVMPNSGFLESDLRTSTHQWSIYVTSSTVIDLRFFF